MVSAETFSGPSSGAFVSLMARFAVLYFGRKTPRSMADSKNAPLDGRFQLLDSVAGENRDLGLRAEARAYGSYPGR
jgi:hypothetical protein